MICRVHRLVVPAAVLMTLPNLASADVVIRGHLPTGVEVRSEDVGFGDLNLITESGQATLMKRLRQAVRDVCDGPLADGRNWQEARRYDACGNTAMADATSKAQTAIAAAYRPSTTVAKSTAAVITVQAVGY